MINRRTLFARLSAVALAPLVKLIPKPEPQYVIGCDVAAEGGVSWVIYSHSSVDAAFARLAQSTPTEEA